MSMFPQMNGLVKIMLNADSAVFRSLIVSPRMQLANEASYDLLENYYLLSPTRTGTQICYTKIIRPFACIIL